MPLCPTMSRASGEVATRRAPPRSRSALISRLRFMRSARQAQQALLPGLSTGPTKGQMLLVQFSQPSFQIITRQRDRQVGGTLHDANAQPPQGSAELGCTLHVDRLNAHTTFLEIFLRDLGRQAQARPIGGYGVRRSARFRDDKAAIDQPLQGFMDLVGWKLSLQRERAPENSFHPRLLRKPACN